MFKKLLLFACVAMMVVFVSCKGDQGEVGPKGDTGATGAAGPAGPAGADGQDGTSGGGALIISTGAAETDSTGGYITGISDLTPEVDSILQSAAVLVYIKSQGVYWPLPGLVVFGTGASATASEFTFVHGIQESTFFVELFQRGWSEDVDDAPDRSFEDVRIVIIPGTVIGRMDAELLKSYEKTIASLNLTEKNVKTASKLKLKLSKK